MYYPTFSFIISFLFWLSLSLAFFYTYHQKPIQPEISLEIDAAMVGEVEQEKQLTRFYSGKIGEIPQQKLESASKNSEQNSVKDSQKKLTPLFQPLPKIPDELREEAFKSEALARFYITKSGTVAKVELIKPSSNLRLNALLLSSLKRWKFSASEEEKSEGEIVSTQDIRVRFAVE